MEKHSIEQHVQPLKVMRLAEKGIAQGVEITKRGMVLSGPALVFLSSFILPPFAAIEAAARGAAPERHG